MFKDFNAKESGFFQLTLVIGSFLTVLFLVKTVFEVFFGMFIRSYISSLISSLVQMDLVIYSLILIIGYFSFYKILTKNIPLTNEENYVPVKISLIKILLFYIIILGTFIYILHLIILYSNSIEPIKSILNTGYSFSFINPIQIVLLFVYFGIVIPITEEILYRKFLINYFSNLRFGVATSSLVTSTMYLFSSLFLLATIPKTLQLFDLLLARFIFSIILCSIYYFTRKLRHTLLLNVSISIFIVLHELAFANAGNQFYELSFAFFKAIFIYVSFFLLVLTLFYYYFKKELRITKDWKAYFRYHSKFITPTQIFFGSFLLILFPSGLSYYIANIFIFDPKLDSNLLLLIYSIILLFILIIFNYKFSNPEILKIKNFLFEEIVDLLTQTINLKSKFVLDLKSFYKNSIKNKLIVIMSIVIKAIVVISLFLPLVILNISGTVKLTLFLFVLSAKIALNFNEHILYSLFDITTNVGFSFGTNGYVFLRNINKDYFFLPTSYYSNPVDWPYGIIASFIWILSVLYLFKSIKTMLSNSKTSSQKLKIFIIYFLFLIVWNVFNFGLFQPSSFIPGNKKRLNNTQQNLNNITLEHIQFFFLPFGFLLLLACLLYYTVSTLVSKIRFRKKQNLEQ